MTYPTFFDARNTLHLFGLNNNFDFLSSLYKEKRLPKVLLFSGNKGIGKSTLTNHLLFSIFDSDNYNSSKYLMKKNSFYKQFKENIFPNIIYIKGSDFQNVSVEEIRSLKNKINQSTILNKNRFIILDDVELFNINSLNALLKMIEEPTNKNYFVLINNKSKPLLETIKSRSLEIKIILDEKTRVNIIENLIDKHNLKPILDKITSKLSPGNFIKFDYLCNEHNINLNEDLTKNISFILNLYKKDKDILFINMIFFIIDNYLLNRRELKNFNNDNLFKIKEYLFKRINDFILYNLNHNSLINDISNHLKYE